MKINSLWKKEEQIIFFTWSRPDIKPTLGEWEQDQRPEIKDTIQKKHQFWNRQWFEEGRCLGKSKIRKYGMQGRPQ